MNNNIIGSTAAIPDYARSKGYLENSNQKAQEELEKEIQEYVLNFVYVEHS